MKFLWRTTRVERDRPASSLADARRLPQVHMTQRHAPRRPTVASSHRYRYPNDLPDSPHRMQVRPRSFTMAQDRLIDTNITVAPAKACIHALNPIRLPLHGEHPQTRERG